MSEFTHPAWFLAIFPLLVGTFIAWRRRVPGLLVGRISTDATKRSPSLRLRVPLLMETLAGIAIIFALARPVGPGDERSERFGIDVMVCLDVSGSMAKMTDPPEGTPEEQAKALKSGLVPNRLESAKKALRTFIKNRPDDRVGLTVFSASVLTLCPPTLDHDFLLSRLNDEKIDVLPKSSTNITDSLGAAINRLREAPSPRRVVLLLTDGEHTAPTKLSPLEVAEKAAKPAKVVIHCVAIGGPTPVQVIPGISGPTWRPWPDAHFEPKVLRKIAEATGGLFQLAEDDQQLQRVMDGIDQLEKTKAVLERRVEYEERFRPFAWIALTLLLLGVFLEATWFLRVP